MVSKIVVYWCDILYYIYYKILGRELYQVTVAPKNSPPPHKPACLQIIVFP